MGSCRQRPQAAIVYTEDPAAGPEAVAEIKLRPPRAEDPAAMRARDTNGGALRYRRARRGRRADIRHRRGDDPRTAQRARGPRGNARGLAVGLYRRRYDPLATLSAREREILALLASGMSNKQIASHLTISSNTVKFHLRTIYSKLGVRNRVQAMRGRRLAAKPKTKTKQARLQTPSRLLPLRPRRVNSSIESGTTRTDEVTRSDHPSDGHRTLGWHSAYPSERGKKLPHMMIVQ